MPTYSKLSQLVNLPLTCKYRKGFENFKTKFGTSPFKAGRLKDPTNDPSDEGNFESALIEKGVAVKDRNWELETYDQNRWQNYFSWTFEKDGEEHKVDLTWTQNKNLTEKLPSEFPRDGIVITPHISDKTIDFEVEVLEPESGDVREMNAQIKSETPISDIVGDVENVAHEEPPLPPLPFKSSETSENYEDINPLPSKFD